MSVVYSYLYYTFFLAAFQGFVRYCLKDHEATVVRNAELDYLARLEEEKQRRAEMEYLMKLEQQEKQERARRRSYDYSR